MLKNIILIAISVLLLGCATAGKVANHRFTDNAYPYNITFPKEYDISAQSAKSVLRVIATKDSDKMTTYVKPMFVVSIRNTEKTLSELVGMEKNTHFEPRYYMGCQVDYEDIIMIDDCEGTIIYYSGSTNNAATVYSKFEDYFMKIEYIANANFYDAQELMYVIENIRFTQ